MRELDQLMDIMQCAFDPHWREAWTREQVANSLALPHTYTILLDELGRVPRPDQTAAGFVLARRAPGEEELLLIAVRPEARGNGLGRRLLEEFSSVATKSGADRIFLEMRSNNPAQKLYLDFGFEPIGRRKNYYRTLNGEPIDAITFGYRLQK